MALTKANNRMIDGAAINILDYGAVGDGSTDDTTAIQAALDAAGDTGTYATVVCPPSPSGNEYIITGIVVKAKTTFLGTGGVLKLKDNTANNAAQNFYVIRNFDGDGSYTQVVYDGLIVDGNSANNTLYNVCDSITCSGEGSIVRNCRILDAADSGIMFSAAKHGMCINNYIDGVKDAGIYVNNSSETNNDLEGAVISGNTCQNCDYGGINIKRSSGYITVSNNTIINCGNGFTIEEFGTGSGGEPDHLIITNNVVKDIGFNFDTLSPAPSQSGCIIQLSTHCVVSNNKFVNVAGQVVVFDGAQYCVVNGNSIRGYQDDPVTASYGNVGVRFTTRDTIVPKYNVCANNIISYCEDEGINVVQGEYNVIEGNIIHDIDGAGTGNQAIVLAAAADNNIVANNIAHGETNDIGINSDALGNIFDGNKQPNGTGTSINGIRRNNTSTSPLGTTTPLYAGEMIYFTTDDQMYFAKGTANTDWIEMQSRPVLETATNIADSSHHINTTGKYTGRLVMDQTNWKLYVARGSSATSVWGLVDGSATVTPS